MSGAGARGALTMVNNLIRFYERAASILGIILMSVIVSVMGVQVFFRYVMNDSLIWAEELSSYMLVLISFLLLGTAFQRGEMMNIELLVGRMPPWLRAAIETPVNLAMIAFLAILGFYGYKFALLNQSTSIPAVDFIVSSIVGETRTVVVSRFWLYLMIPIGLAILALHIFVATCKVILVAMGKLAPPQSMTFNKETDS